MAAKTKWLPIFTRFIEDLRIDSKEVPAEDERGAKLDLWGTQRHYLKEISSGLDEGIRDFRTLKGRQQGISTVSLALTIFWMAFYPGTIGAFAADSDSNRNVFRQLIKRVLLSFPPDYFGGDFRIVKGADNRDFTQFSNGSRLDYLTAGRKKNATLGESRGYSFALCTEVANYGDASGLQSFRETLATDHPNRLFLYESTAKSYNHWYLMCKEAEDHPLVMRFIFIPWCMKELNRIGKRDKRFQLYGLTPPSGDEQHLINEVKARYGVVITPEMLAWYRECYSKADSTDSFADLAQNQPWLPEQAFVATGRHFFNTRLLQQRIGEVHEQIEFMGYRYFCGTDVFAMKLEQITDPTRLGDVTLRVWEEPIETGRYAIGCDPAYGRDDDSDFSAISVWRCYADKLVQVAEYSDRRTETRQLAWILSHLAAAYSNCTVNIELGGPGRAVLSELEALRTILQSELYAREVKARGWEDALSNVRDYTFHRPDNPGSRGYIIHFETTWKRKMEMMNQLRDSISSSQLVANSIPLLTELSHMVQHHSDIAPSGEGTNDDRVFSAGLANRTWLDNIRLGMIVEGLSYEVVAAEEAGLTTTETPRHLRHIVYNFFVKLDERAGLGSDEGLSAYMRERM